MYSIHEKPAKKAVNVYLKLNKNNMNHRFVLYIIPPHLSGASLEEFTHTHTQGKKIKKKTYFFFKEKINI